MTIALRWDDLRLLRRNTDTFNVIQKLRLRTVLPDGPLVCRLEL
jgi:hypothetical protein